MNIPDFILQFEEILRTFRVEAEITSRDWSDGVSERYYKMYIQRYNDVMGYYLWGDPRPNTIRGYGLNELLQIIEAECSKFPDILEELIEDNYYVELDSVHDRMLDRINYDSKINDHLIPGSLDSPQISKINKERKNSKLSW